MKITDSLSRLKCFEALYLDSDSDNLEKSVDNAFAEFKALREYDGEGGWAIVSIDTSKGQCVFHDRALLLDGFPGNIKPVWGNFHQLFLNLNSIDTVDFDALRSGTNISMPRGEEITHSTLSLNNAAGWREESTALNIERPMNSMNRPSYQEILDKRLVRQYFNQFQIKNFGEYSSEKVRSVSWSFSRFWPEDSQKIHDAFEVLVKVCKQR